jgi:hypothetical protein
MTQRLPIPGSDNGSWGDILNGFLEVSHASDGTLASSVVGTNQLQNNAVTNAQLDSTTQSKLVAAASAVQTVNGKSPTSGAVTLVATDVGAITQSQADARYPQSGGYVAPGTGISSSGALSESALYIPGIVADNGVTDNYTAINTYLTSLASGQNNLVLPPGNIGIGTPIVPPMGVILRGSGWAQYPGATSATNRKGTNLVPLTGSAPTQLVSLTTAHSGVADLNLYADGTVSCSHALSISGLQCQFENVGIYGGSVSTLNISGGGSLLGNHFSVYVTSPTTTTLAISNTAPDCNISNGIVSDAGCILGGNDANWSNIHFVGLSTTASGTQSLIEDYGNQTFTGCTFDSIGFTSAVAMIDRTHATSPSCYVNCNIIQSNALTATFPIFLETATTNAGATLVGVQFLDTAGSFTHFISGSLASTIVAFCTSQYGFSSTFTDTIPPLGTFIGNMSNGVPFSNTLTTLATTPWTTAIGANALSTTTGTGNTALGYEAGQVVTTGTSNTFVGFQAAQSTNTSGNTALGYGTIIGSAATYALALGLGAHASYSGSVALGTDSSGGGATPGVANEIRLGTTNQHVVSPGYIDVSTVGQGLRVAEGSNAKQGTATLAAGTVTVANTSVTATSRIFLTNQSLGTVGNPQALAITARTAGTSFTITSASTSDTSVIAYEIFEVG